MKQFFTQGKRSKIDSVFSQITIDQDTMIAKGSLKEVIAKVYSLSFKERVDLLFTFFGSTLRETYYSRKRLHLLKYIDYKNT